MFQLGAVVDVAAAVWVIFYFFSGGGEDVVGLGGGAMAQNKSAAPPIYGIFELGEVAESALCLGVEENSFCAVLFAQAVDSSYRAAKFLSHLADCHPIGVIAVFFGQCRPDVFRFFVWAVRDA